MKESPLEKFKEKVRVEKCDGVIKEVNLAVFIANYNRLEKRYSIYIGKHVIVAVDKITSTETKFAFSDNKIDAMLTVMLFVIVNANMTFSGFWTSK